MIDMHSHILPNIDDGSSSNVETINMIKEAYEVGFTTVVSTSHYFLNHYEAAEEHRKELIGSIENELQQLNIPMQLCIGSEIFVTNNMVELLKEHEASSINGTRYVLFELPFEQEVPHLKDTIYSLLSHNYIPIIAHPERYTYVQKNPNMLLEYIDLGVLFQSNFGSIIGQYGKNAQKTIKLLLKNNFIHFLGSDAHRNNSIYTAIPKALLALKETISDEELEELTVINPTLVLENKEIDIRRPTKIKGGHFYEKIFWNRWN
ncbi:MAG: capsular biosynthesis protein [Clostridia bacterium]|nr:capsular biosynthesis protein [Clostridia bacterium]